MRVLVTGASGFIGAALAARLAARGDRVRALVRRSSRRAGLEALGAEIAFGDVGEPASLAGAVDGCDAVVHLAGVVKALGRDEFFRVNAEGTVHLCRACADAARRPALLLVSSLAAAGPSSPSRPRSEEDAPAPVSDYGHSKLAAEQALRGFTGRLEATVVRPPVVYGPGDREFLPPLFRMARLGLVPKVGFGAKRYSLVHVEDLVDGSLAALERGERLGRDGSEGIYFLADGGAHAWGDIVRAAAAALGRRALVVPLPEVASLAVAAVGAAAAALTGRPAILSFDKIRELRQSSWTCAIDRAVRELGFAPRLPLAEGMRQSAEWFAAAVAPG